MVGSGPGPCVHFPDNDPVFERPAKRLRITGKSSAVRRALVCGDGLPTPKRWKMLVPQGTGASGDEGFVPHSLFPSYRCWLTSLSGTRDLSLQVQVFFRSQQSFLIRCMLSRARMDSPCSQ